MMLFAIIAIIAIVLFLPRLVQKNSIVINTRDGIIRECDLLSLVPRESLFSFFQKFVEMKEIISKKSKNMIVRSKLELRNNLDKVCCKLYLLGNGKQRDGPFLRKFRGSYSRC